VEVNEIFQNSCVVSFKPSKDDGGAPITKYIIERLDLSLKAQWDNVGEVMQGEKCVYKVTDLVAKKEYKFRIRAMNKLGSSEPAIFAKPVLAKDPWGEFSQSELIDILTESVSPFFSSNFLIILYYFILSQFYLISSLLQIAYSIYINILVEIKSDEAAIAFFQTSQANPRMLM